jgi:hypothetical protein
VVDQNDAGFQHDRLHHRTRLQMNKKKLDERCVWLHSTHSHLQVAIPHYGYKHVDKNERHSDH